MSENKIPIGFSSIGTTITAMLLYGGIALFRQDITFNITLALWIILFVFGMELIVTIIQLIVKAIENIIEK